MKSENRITDSLILQNIEVIRKNQEDLKKSQDEINNKLFTKLDEFCKNCFEYRENSYREIGELNLQIQNKATAKELEELRLEVKNKTGIIAIVTMMLIIVVEGIKAGVNFLIK
jgi:hypothetical protein